MNGEIRFESDATIATLTLSNPAKLNAINATMWSGLRDAMARIAAQSGLRCVILTGDGDKAFAAGAPLTGKEKREAFAFLHTRDYAEDLAAFLEKRAPHFTGE